MRQPSHAGVSRLAARCAFLSLVFLVLTSATARAQSNPIVLENQQPGSSAWDIGTDHLGKDAVGQIKGYASAASVNKGENITFYVSTNPTQTYTIDVYRIGWYQGLGGRLMQHIGPLNGITQPTCPMDATTGKIECGWAPAYILATQTTWTSGVYLAVLTNAQGYQNLMIFVVRDDTRVAALLYQQPVTTYQAYNDYPDDGLTGKSLYDFNSYGVKLAATGYKSAAKVSFDRPYADSGIDEGFRSDYGEVNFIRWMEQSGYDVAYSTDVETHSDGYRLLNYRGFFSVGHDEYWSKPMYDAVTAARDAGVNLGFFGADALSWQIRFEPSSSGVPNRVEVCYKDVNLDPITDPTLKTINWYDPALNRPGQTLMGVQYNTYSYPTQNGQGFFPSYVVTNSGNWVYAGTGFKDGDSVRGIVGYEADLYDSSFPSPNAVGGTYTLLSHSPWGTGAHSYSNSSVYQAPSGAWVFATGTMSWNWALDSYGHGYNLVDARIQQTTANVFNQFVVGSGNPPPTVSSVAPTSGPAAGGTAIAIQGANFLSGATVNIGGTAATGVTFVNSTSLTATTPAGTAGTVSVSVTNPDGRIGTLPNAFTYTSTAPTVSNVSPNIGPTSGGTVITLTGINYAAGATVSVGGTPASGVTVLSSTSITATTPAHAAGAVSVTVMNTDGQSGTLTSGFTYQLPAPTVVSVTPVSGPTTGGTPITISGTNFTASATVSLGSSAATGVVIVNSTTITATTPAHAAGAVNVTVTNSDGQGASLTNGFTYISTPAPTVSSVSPNTGWTTGGTAVTITGANFAAGATVSFASSAATGVSFVSATTITAITPAHAAGSVSVTVTNPDAQIGSLAGGFTYTLPPAPTLISVTPNGGFRGTAVPVTLIGTNFTATGTKVVVSGSGVTVGAITVVDSGTITATFTIGATATISARNVSVTTPGGTSNTQTFTVQGPTLASIAPNTGARGTNAAVTLSGSGLTGATAITVSGSGVTVSNLVVVNDTTVTATFAITAGAGLTSRNVSITAPGGTSNTRTFTVVVPPVPTLTSVGPNSGVRGTAVPVTLIGTDFTATGTKVTVSGSGVTVGTITVVDSATITTTFTITANAGLTARNVSVTTPGGTSNTQTFTVLGPTLTSVAPNPVTHGSGVLLTLTGTNLAGATAVTVSGTGNTCAVSGSNSTTVSAVCTLNVGADTVKVTTPIGATGTVPLTVN